jgi:hypothetical protein
MLTTFLSIHPEFSKHAAWLTVLLLSAVGASGIKLLAGRLLLKLYEIIIQKSALP